MKLEIDTSLETPAELRLYARFLEMLAAADENPVQKLPVAGTAEGVVATYAGANPFAQPPTMVAPVPPPAMALTTASNAALAAAVVPEAPSAVSAPEGLDKDGLPWDARIHSSGENKLNSDGTWRQKRGVNPMLVSAVTAELRARASAPLPVQRVPVLIDESGKALYPPPVSLPNTLPVPPPPLLLPDGPVATVPASLPVPPAPAVGTVPAPSTGPTFTQLVIQANKYAAEGRYDMDRLVAAVQKAGGTGLESLTNNPPLIAATWNIMEESIRA